ncbi:MAG: tRNA (guanosine(46)-N7)-methyltransferase TrmB [Phycisphaeraceae bacterium]|nr:tRNA (guanosine(46)-N7)-methyltransferase TrmB [Phycisphaeraceae bacterium]
MPRALQLDVSGYGISMEQLPALDHGPIDLNAWFEHPAPIELEIGSGKGTFLIQHAPLHPRTNFLGLEYARAYWRHAADRIRRHQLANARMLHCEATMFLRNFVARGALAAIHVYFPDPWPKKRHHKRRLIQEPTLRLFHQALVGGGSVHLTTDHEDYFQSMAVEAAKVSDLFERGPFNPPTSAGAGELVGSNFERKYRREGRPFFAMSLRARAHTASS